MMCQRDNAIGRLMYTLVGRYNIIIVQKVHDVCPQIVCWFGSPPEVYSPDPITDHSHHLLCEASELHTLFYCQLRYTHTLITLWNAKEITSSTCGFLQDTQERKLCAWIQSCRIGGASLAQSAPIGTLGFGQFSPIFFESL